MARTAKEQAEAHRERKAEYSMMRSVLIEIARNDTVKPEDRLEAIRLVYQIDTGEKHCKVY